MSVKQLIGSTVVVAALTGLGLAVTERLNRLERQLEVVAARVEGAETVSDLAFKTATRCATRDDLEAVDTQTDYWLKSLGRRIWVLEREYPVGTGR